MNTYESYMQETGVYGTVIESKHPLVYINGLPDVKPREMIVFENGMNGMIMDIESDRVHALGFTHESIPLGTHATRTKTQAHIELGDGLQGQTINALGKVLSTNSPIQTTETREIFRPAPGVQDRVRITEPLQTGITIMDLLLPLGKGQRELVLGDVKTGKTSALLSVLINQIQNEGVVGIYAAIGKRRSEIKQITAQLYQQGVLQNMVIVASTASDVSSMIYLTPYTAMTVAEYFRDRGLDVVMVMDDLSVHGQAYREISLLSQRFPGRDSYPGDIFFTHAQLLERAGNVALPEDKSASITCFPIATTVEGDISGYIATNLMGMTDGHILFDVDIYNKGYRPAINIPLSVTRVGRQTQSTLLRSISVEILSILSQFTKIQSMSHLGSELSGESVRILQKGEALQLMIRQERTIMPRDVQVLLFGIIWLNLTPLTNQAQYNSLLKKLLDYHADTQGNEVMQKLIASESLSDYLLSLKKDANIATICSTKTTL
jgi:F-type H+-transporting ATPase subunit alpha